jgi:hypothetical protein
VAIHAGPTPNATPVNSETTKANSITGMEGEALIGTLANPAKVGNANRRIRRVHANAIATPAAPPNSESKILSVRGCLRIREVWAPRAMLKDVCLRRSIPRTSIRLATLAQTISNTKPETITDAKRQRQDCRDGECRGHSQPPLRVAQILPARLEKDSQPPERTTSFVTSRLPLSNRTARSASGRVMPSLIFSSAAISWEVRSSSSNSRSTCSFRNSDRRPLVVYKNPSRLVSGVTSLPLGTPVELELIFEVSV